MTKDESIKAQLDKLRKIYQKKLPDKIAMIEHCCEQLLNQDTDGALTTAKELHRYLHSLAGGGATFGFREFGKKARFMELLLAPYVNEGKQPPGAVVQQVVTAVDELKKLMNEGCETGFMSNIHSEDDTPVTQSHPLLYILEDDDVQAKEAALQLSHFGYRVKTFNSPTELEQALVKGERPNVLIADIIFQDSEKTGIDCIQSLRRQWLSDVAVIFVSSASDFKTRLSAIRAGADGYFSKPVNIDKLVEKLEKLTDACVEKPYRVLFVDDDQTLVEHFKLVLKRHNMQLQALSQPELIFDVIAQFDPELIVLDLYMPNCSGIELAKLIRQQEAYIGTPIVYLSTEDDADRQLQALVQGADDFLTKPISDQSLAISLLSKVKRARQLHSLMNQDSLTGLLKHTIIKSQLNVELERALRHNTQMAFVMIDLDHFKQVNDLHGHLLGDRVIKSLARLLQKSLRKLDCVGRYGGEEFAVVMPDTSIADAVKVIDKIREKFIDIQFTDGKGTFTVSFSAGVSGYPLLDSSEAINQSADEALYQAKESGRNQVCGCA